MTAIPMEPGYYWAKWRIASDGTHEGDELTPSDRWEIVQVNENVLGWEDDPTEDEALSVDVPGVRETQWRDCFVWGPKVADIERAPPSGSSVLSITSAALSNATATLEEARPYVFRFIAEHPLTEESRAAMVVLNKMDTFIEAAR